MTRRTVGGRLPEGEVSAAVPEGEVSAASSTPEESVPTVATGGLQLLGSADTVVCEGDVCWLPPADD